MGRAALRVMNVNTKRDETAPLRALRATCAPCVRVYLDPRGAYVKVAGE